MFISPESRPLYSRSRFGRMIAGHPPSKFQFRLVGSHSRSAKTTGKSPVNNCLSDPSDSYCFFMRSVELLFLMNLNKTQKG
mmetsp:Transcript_8744/g.32321  ORF Transcript_8744/g.32321 Transcript_8744/m.32321 type:complete len:81 (+) Transcript_8744:964-1206(+)